MSAVHKNTLVVDFSVLPERPKLDMVQRFVEKSLGLNPTDLRSIQLHNIRHCVLIQMADPEAAAETASKHHLKHAFRINPAKKIAIPVYVDDGDTVDVRIHDLPPDLDNIQIAEAMLHYGEVLTIRDEVWRAIFAGLPNGVRVLKMKLVKPVPSYVTICGFSSLATHTGQILTCRRCGSQRHVAKSCSEAAKKQQQKKSNKIPPALVLPPTDPATVQSQVIVPHTQEDNCNDGFTVVAKKGKAKRHLEEKKAPAEKRTCLDDDDDNDDDKSSTPDDDLRNDNGQPLQPTIKTTTPKRRLWKPTG